MTPEGVGLTLLRVFGRALTGPQWLSRHVRVGTMTVAEHLARLVSVGIAQDIGKVKTAMVEKYGAEADIAKAEARIRLAAATEAENAATLARRDDALARLEKRRREAEVRKIEAEAAKSEAEADILTAGAAVAQAEARAIVAGSAEGDIAQKAAALKDAVRRLNQKGGGLFVIDPALKRLIEGRSEDTPES